MFSENSVTCFLNSKEDLDCSLDCRISQYNSNFLFANHWNVRWNGKCHKGVHDYYKNSDEIDSYLSLSALFCPFPYT